MRLAAEVSKQEPKGIQLLVNNVRFSGKKIVLDSGRPTNIRQIGWHCSRRSDQVLAVQAGFHIRSVNLGASLEKPV